MLDLDLSKEVGLALVSQSEGAAVTRFVVPARAARGSGHLHGNYLYGLLDYAAFFTVVTVLRPDESAVTHDAHFTLLDPVPAGATVELVGSLDRRGRHIAFLSVDAWWVDGASRRCVARARITKSIMAMQQRTRARSTPGQEG